MNKKNKEYYLVTLDKGEYDSYWIQNLFITDKAYKAKSYCSKGNSILKKYKDYYSKLLQEARVDKDMDYCHISDRKDFVHGSFGYYEIQLKTAFK